MKRTPEEELNDARVLKTCKPTSNELLEFLSSLQSVFGKRAVEEVTNAEIEKAFFDGVARIPVSEWARFAYFDASHYSRNLLAAQENFSLILLCWEPGQSTPVHTHSNPDCAARRSWGMVLQGDLLLSEYAAHETKSGRQITSTTLIAKGTRMVETTPRAFHVLENINKTSRAMSLHLYAPCFLDCCWQDSLHAARAVPVAYTPISRDSIAPTVRCTGIAGAYFTSFDALAGLIMDELRRGKDIARISRILEALRFNPKEYRRYAHWTSGRYTRNLIGYTSAFTLLMLCWDRGQESPIHDHAGSNCFVKMLEGELHEVRYDASNPKKLALKSITHIHDEQVAYIDDTMGVHKMVNPSLERGAISLHVYMPPYTKCSIFNLLEGTRHEATIAASNAFSDKPFTPLELTPNDKGPLITSVTDLVNEARKVFTQFPDPGQEQVQAVQSVLDRVHFLSSEWVEHVHFSDFEYTRMLLTLDDKFSLMLLCWNAGQSCAIHSHDHAPDNFMFVKTLIGELRIQRFTDASGTSLLSETLVNSDSPTTMFKNRDIGYHTTANASTTQKCLSLHLYSPPMLECVSSSGAVAPVVYSEKAAHIAKSASKPVLWLDGGLGAVEDAVVSKLHASVSVFSNFQALMEMLRSILDQDSAAPSSVSSEIGRSVMTASVLDAKLSVTDRVSKLLSKFEFNPKEIELYKCVNGNSFSRRRVVMHPTFEVLIVCWKAGQQSPIHNHGGSSSWIKILEGSLKDTHFSKPERGLPPYVVQTLVHRTNEVAFLGPDMIHQTMAIDKDCTALTVYSPPYSEWTCFCPTTGKHNTSKVCSTECGASSDTHWL